MSLHELSRAAELTKVYDSMYRIINKLAAYHPCENGWGFCPCGLARQLRNLDAEREKIGKLI